jgi:membrane dipeptidase
MATHLTTRRGFTLWAAGILAATAMPLRAQEKRRFLADMHSHYGMFLPRLFGFDLAKHMKETGTTLLAWSIVDDSRWITRGPRGLVQGNVPNSGDLWNYFRTRLTETEGNLARWGLQKALTPADIDAAIAGEPRVLIASEAANFLEGDPSRLAIAHAAGLRHTQIVHYIRSPLGDFQTAEPRHGGLTPTGAKVVTECKRLGIVVDLAHGTPNLVDAAMEASDAAMVWSHSWISAAGGSWQEAGYVARSLALPIAKKIAARGGAVGLWTVRVKGDPNYPVHNARSFADEVMHMCDLIGPQHVAFGTDMEGAGPGPILSDYVDLRDVANDLARRGLSESMLDEIFIGNYARIVKQAMRGASTT